LPQNRLRHDSRLKVAGSIGIHYRLANLAAKCLIQPNRIYGHRTGDLA
jgi:hypothetical protein